MSTMDWVPEKIDAILEELLPQNDRRSYGRMCAHLAARYGCGEADTQVADKHVRDGDPINRLLWGMCVLVRPYPGKAHRGSRSPRNGPFTWAERKCLGWATNGDSKQQREKPDAKYMANLLQRDEDEVRAEMERIGPSRGRVGFFS